MYSIYFLCGYINITSLRAPSHKSFIFVVFGLACYFFGIYISKRFFDKRLSPSGYDSEGIDGETDIMLKLFKISIIVTFLLIIIYAILYDIPIINPSMRSEMPSEIYFIISILPLSISLLLAYEICDKGIKSFTVVYLLISGIIMTVFTAYRSPTIVFIITVALIINYCYKKFSHKNIILLLTIIGIIIIGIQQYRMEILYSSSSFDDINPNNYPNIIIAAHITCHEGAIVFSDIINMSQIHGLLHGQFFQRTFATLLPGSQMGPRTFVSLLRETRLESSTTPSILGGPYLDFGIFGIIGFMIILGIVLNILYKYSQIQYENTLKKAANVTSYAYFSAVSILSIHVGLLEPTTIIILIFILIIHSIINGWYKRKHVLIGWMATILAIFLLILSSIAFPEISKEEEMGIEFCQQNIPNEKIVGLDEYYARTGVSLQDKRFKVIYDINKYIINTLGGHDELKYFLMNKTRNVIKRYSSGLITVRYTGINKVYSTDNIVLYKIYR